MTEENKCKCTCEECGDECNPYYKRLEQENKELKEENKQHIKEKQILHERLYCYAYEKDCHLVCKQQNCLLKNSYAYRSALEEIHKAIKSYDLTVDNGASVDTLYTIGKIINEVLQ